MNREFSYKEVKKAFIDAMIFKFKEKVDDFGSEKTPDGNELKFSTGFKFYDFFYVKFHFNSGEIFFSIFQDKKSQEIRLNNSQHRYENLDMDKFLNELQEEIELRIPDKYLRRKGWLV